MTDFYVDSNAAGANNGTSWTDAWTSITSAPGGISAGDRVFVAHNHSESPASAISLSWPGSKASPNRIISANSGSGAPPSTIQAGASIATTGASEIIFATTGAVYVYGISLTAGDSTNIARIKLGGVTNSNAVFYENCPFKINNTNSVSDIQPSLDTDGSAIMKNCTFEFSNANQGLDSNTNFIIIGGSLVGTTFPINFIQDLTNGNKALIEGFDFSAGSTTMDIARISNMDNLDITVRNCKLPASWSGTLTNTTPVGSTIVSMFNSDDGDTNYKLWVEQEYGSIRDETVLVKDSGATDGNTPISWKMVSDTDVEWPNQTLVSLEIVKWNGIVGSSITVAVDILHDSLTNLQNDEIWLEVQYLGDGSFPLSSFIDDAAADYLATPADQDTSTATWTTTGMTNPNEQQLSVTFTPQEKGFIHAKVHLAKPSYTVYVDPLLLVT